MKREYAARPVVGVLANRIADAGLPAQAVDEKYLNALIEVAGLSVVVIPALAGVNPPDDLLNGLDGLVLTGSVSNVHPSNFAPGADAELYRPFDQGRDQVALELIRLSLVRDIPLLAICRGMQELNVSCGGTLTSNILDDACRVDHRPWDPDAPPGILYGAAHAIEPVAGGHLELLADGNRPMVNSVHVQAIERLGDRLAVEAFAPDGTIEAVRVKGNRFAIGVQWHPEYEAARNPLSRRLFESFGIAVRAFAANRAGSASSC